MDKRLVKLLQSGKIGGGNLYFLDTYNQAVHEDVACTIRTNINTANHHFIFERMSDKVIQIGNLIDDTNRGFKNPQTGRVYSPEGIAPTINTCQGGGREPKIIVEITDILCANNIDSISTQEE